VRVVIITDEYLENRTLDFWLCHFLCFSSNHIITPKWAEINVDIHSSYAKMVIVRVVVESDRSMEVSRTSEVFG
jgi:hypothetical protein